MRIFPTGVPVIGNELAGRDSEKNKLKNLLRIGQSVILYGPRRIGKTSLALTVLNELKDEGFYIGHTDIFETPNLSMLAQRITETTLENKKLAKFIRIIKENLSEAFRSVEFKQVVNEYEWILKFSEKSTDIFTLFSDALDFPERFAKKHNRNIIMFFDEIGDIEKFDGETYIKLMRSKFQLHRNVTYLFASSHQSLMENIFVKSSGPFYRFGQLMKVGTIPNNIFSEFIKRKFTKVNLKYDDKAIDYLLKITGAYPYYTQLVCKEVYFYAIENNVSIKKKTIDIALNEALCKEDLYFSKIWEEISKNSAQIEILHNIIEKKGKVYENANDNNINLSRTLNQLLNKGIINKEAKGYYKFTDPLLAEYLKRKFE